MNLPRILAKKDSSQFRSRQVSIHNQSGVTYIEPVGEDLDFRGMSALRKPEDLDKLRYELAGKGHTFANLGLSVVLTTTYDHNHYLVLVRQDRPDFGDSVAKLLSGYVSADKLTTPLLALDEEISEEFLPCTSDGKVLGGMRSLQPLPRPFSDTVTYDDNVAFQLFETDIYSLPGVPESEVIIEGNPIVEGKPVVCYHLPTNSAQIVFSYHIDIPRVPNIKAGLGHAEASYLAHHHATLSHSEDEFDPESGSLEVKLQDRGILMIKLDGGRITDEVVSTYGNGKLEKFVQPVILSEAFAPKQDGIASANHIPLEEYLNSL